MGRMGIDMSTYHVTMCEQIRRATALLETVALLPREENVPRS